jgi:hypothetical protein
MVDLKEQTKAVKEDIESHRRAIMQLYRPEPDLPLFDANGEDPDAYRRCRRCEHISTALSAAPFEAGPEWNGVLLCPDCLSQINRDRSETSGSSSLAEEGETGSSEEEWGPEKCSLCSKVTMDVYSVDGDKWVCSECVTKYGGKIARDANGYDRMVLRPTLPEADENPPPISLKDLRFTQARVSDAFNELATEHGLNKLLWTLSAGEILGDPSGADYLKVSMAEVRELAKTL